MSSRSGGDRTHDFTVMSGALYQLSYGALIAVMVTESKEILSSTNELLSTVMLLDPEPPNPLRRASNQERSGTISINRVPMVGTTETNAASMKDILSIRRNVPVRAS